MDSCRVTDRIALVFDFDGTICRVFKNFDLSNVAKNMSSAMQTFGIEFSKERDAFDVFEEIVNQTKLNSKNRIDALSMANDILTQAEVEAVETAEVVNGAAQVLSLLKEKGAYMGISTNNSVDCVKHFIKLVCPEVSMPIVGRVGVRPELMKPNVWSLVEVIRELKCKKEDVIFIGDSNRDFYCAKNAGVKFIGMAPVEYKKERLLKLLPERDIVTDFYELINLLKTRYKFSF